MTIIDDPPLYRDLMRFKPGGLTPNAWAVKAGVSRTVWTDMRRHGNPSRRTLEKLLAAVGSTLAEFEALRVGDMTEAPGPSPGVGDRPGWNWIPAHLPPLPLLGTRLGNSWGEPNSGIRLTEVDEGDVLERLPRPLSLAGDRDAYALTIVGDMMWPRFRPDRRIAVSPATPPMTGDDVLVSLREPHHRGTGRRLCLIQELVSRTATKIELRQFKPERRFEVSATDVESVHKIAGELF